MRRLRRGRNERGGVGEGILIERSEDIARMEATD